MRLSVVLPLLNESGNIRPLYCRLVATLDRIGCDYEILFVDDGSTDDSLAIIEELAQENDRVKYISLSRNFGHEIASTAGLDRADGDAVVLMDADLQDPPELIELLMEPWLRGYDVVYATRSRRTGDNLLKRCSSFLFYRAMRRFSSLELPLDTGDFRLMDRRVVQAFRQFSETQRFVRGLITWMGFRQASVEYERPPRHAGSGKYGAWKLLKLGLDALVGFSTLPLRLVSVFGILCVAAAIAGAASNLLSPSARTAGSEHGVGLSCLALLCGTQLLAIGILGEYIGRVHRDVLRRPLYLVDRQHGWESPSSNSTTAVSSCRTQNARGARIDERELGSRRRVAGHATQLGRRQATGEVR